MDYLKVGQIVNTFGIKGELKIYLHTDFPEERFKKGSILLIGDESTPNLFSVTVKNAKPYKNMYLILLDGLEDINKVEKYKGKFLWIKKEQQGELAEGEFYYHEIIGSKVLTTEGEELGVIKEILTPGANDVWVVKPNKGNKDILIPYVNSIVKNVNTVDKIVTIEVIEGLLG